MPGNDIQKDQAGWGAQVGQALAVLIPALLSGIAGYLAAPKQASAPNPQQTIQADPSTGTQKIAEYEEEIFNLKGQVAQLSPSKQLVAVSFIKNPSGTDADNCVDSISQNFNRNNINFKIYNHLFQLTDTDTGDFVNCDTNGNATVFSFGDKSKARRNYIEKVIESQWPDNNK